MEGILQSIDFSITWIALMLTFHLLFKDCSGKEAIKKLEERIMREHIGEQLSGISKRLDKLTDKIEKLK